MNRLFALMIICLPGTSVCAQEVEKLKNNALVRIDSMALDLVEISYKIWSYAEPSYAEHQSSRLLISKLRKHGFQLESPLGEYETMFMATYGNEGPVIGFFGEYDADRNASNHLTPYKNPIVPNGFGHGAGHNLLGVGALGAALALKELIDNGDIKCVIKYFGTTDETGFGGKTYLARSGYFDDLDISLYWHPAPVTVASTNSSWDAMAELEIMINGPSHEFTDFKEGATTWTALNELLTYLKDVKKNDPDNFNFNYSIQTNNSDLKNLPDSIRLGFRIQHAAQVGLIEILDNIRALGDSIQNSSKLLVNSKVTKAHHEFIVNETAMKVVFDNMSQMEPIKYTDEEVNYAHKLQSSIGSLHRAPSADVIRFQPYTKKSLYGYSSDIGDASWFAPEVYFVTTCLPRGVPMHEWTGTVFSGHSIGQKGMLYAVKVMTLFVIDYLSNPNLQKDIYDEFLQRTAGYSYQNLISDE